MQMVANSKNFLKLYFYTPFSPTFIHVYRNGRDSINNGSKRQFLYQSMNYLYFCTQEFNTLSFYCIACTIYSNGKRNNCIIDLSLQLHGRLLF